MKSKACFVECTKQLSWIFAFFSLAFLSVAAPSIVPVSGGNAVSASAAGGSFLPVFSEDGRFLVYLSHANNLVTNDDLGLSLDVFLTDIISGYTELISVNTSQHGGANADCTHAAVSRYGPYVAFASRASNLTTSDTNGAVDVFFRSFSPVAAPFTTLVSRIQGDGSPPEPVPFATRPLSTAPQLAQDRVVFASAATNLVPGLEDTNGTYDVFVRDIFGVFALARLVSVANVPGVTPDGSSHSPQISSNRQHVGFISTASNLLSADITNRNRGGDIYIRDLNSSRTWWASTNTRSLLVGAFPAPPSTYTCFNYALSGDGRHVVYQANASEYAPYSSNVLLYFEIGSTGPVRIATDSDPIGRPQISSFGDWVAFSSRSNIYLWSRATGSNTLISASTNGGPANGPSHSPVMSADPNARLIAFVSKATDLLPTTASNHYQIYAYDRLGGTIVAVSVNTNGSASDGDFETANLAVPREGGWYVAFDSPASDLVPNDFNGASDIFLRDLAINQTRLVSRAHSSLPARTTAPMSTATPNSISADGQVIAFTALDNPFIPDDTNIWQDVFLRNLASGDLKRLSGPQLGPGPFWPPQAAVEAVVSATGNYVAYAIQRGTGGTDKSVFWYDVSSQSNRLVTATVAGNMAQGDGISLSSDGTLVVFQSTASARDLSTNVLSDPNGNQSDVFARDMTTDELKIVSVNYTGQFTGNGASSNAVLSPNARWVAFESTATDLLPSNVTSGIRSAFARDLLSNTTEVVSVSIQGISQMGSRGRPAFSGDSRYVAFVGDNYPILRRDLQLKTSAMVTTGGENPSLNWDGRFVAYQTLPFQAVPQIYVTDMQSGLSKLVSANSSGTPANGSSTTAQITPDGRFIVFQSLASDLVQNDNNNASDIFVADRILGTVVLLSINASGTASGNGASSKATLSADGHKIVFQSLANDLITGDYNDRRDVFVATLSMPDSDGDGMDDDYEITYFGDLSHDGSADSDGDGQTDYEEFLAGTNPRNDASILRAITVTPTFGPATYVTVIWSAVPGRSYAVQYKDSLNAPWSALPGTVRATASTAARIHVVGSISPRFYRILLAE
jgi:hypothetical protein